MSPRRVLALTRYDALGASSRVRVLQFIPALRERGIEVTAAPLLGDPYIRDLYRRRRNHGAILRGYRERVKTLRGAGSCDTLWVEKESLPWIPYAVEHRLSRHAPRVVLDFDDAVWLRYAAHDSAVVRAALGGKFERLMRDAHAVGCGNAWLQDHARAAGAHNAILLPSVVDTDRYTLRPGNGPRDRFTVGWIGSPATVHYLRGIAGALRRLCETVPVRLVCIGVSGLDLPGIDVECRPWTVDTEVRDIGMLDAGIMPLTDGGWERGKCGYKLLQYMACGVPAVGSAVGANMDIITDGKDGFLVREEADWVQVLRKLAADPELCRNIGAAGRARVEQAYSIRAHIDRLAGLLAP